MSLERMEGIIEVRREIGARLLMAKVLVSITTAFTEFVICLVDDVLKGLVQLSNERRFACGLRVEGGDVNFLRNMLSHTIYKTPFEQ